MMDELKQDVRAGLVDLIFAIYEDDAKDVCNSLEKIGVLKPGVDRISIEKIARFSLKEFNLGVKSGEWDNQLSKEEQKKITRKKRAQLGQDLLSVGSDVPFKFPPTFTFVFRAFTSLDGIGKGLDPKYDLTRLAQPFLKELVDLKDGSAAISFLNSFGKKVGLRPVDIETAVTSPRSIAQMTDILTRMEQGDLKVRCRVLESEQSFSRMELVQNNMGLAIAASAFLNFGMLLGQATKTAAGEYTVAAKALLAVAGILGAQVPVGILKLKKLDKQFADLKQ
jgi:predicted unusual protein kinase regulating ubiquinone biosynthesis (AarF/ABC1/UbiB family)